MDKENKPQESDFSFIQETIKDETTNHKNSRKRLLSIAMLGIVFGICTGIGFHAIKPWAERTFQTNKTQVTIPKDEEETANQAQDAEDEQELPQITQENIVEINKQLYEIGEKASQSMAVVTSVPRDAKWTDTSQENRTAGMVVSNNGQEYLILVPSVIAKEGSSFHAAFSDGYEYSATLKVKDDHFGYAIVGVQTSEVRSNTKKRIKSATLGNSNTVVRGDVVIAVGSQFGNQDDLGYGIVSSVKNTSDALDGIYDLITTDIPRVEGGTGVLINLEGQVIGLVNSKLTQTGDDNISNAYAISPVKSMIEKLSNGYQVPYIGIHGRDVTEEISQQQEIPRGIYVTEIETESAGLQAGIKSGDVINSINGKEVQSLKAYHDQLMQCNVGDEIEVVGQRLGAGGYVNITFTVTLASQ